MVINDELKAEILLNKGKQVREVTNVIDNLHDKIYAIVEDPAFENLDDLEVNFDSPELEEAIDDLRSVKEYAEEALAAIDRAYRGMPEDIFDDLAKKLQ